MADDSSFGDLRQALGNAGNTATQALSESLSRNSETAFAPLDKAAERSAGTIERTLVGAVTGARTSWDEVLSRMAASLTNLAVKASVLDPLDSLISQATGSDGGLGGVLGDLIGGARAEGGPVAAGETYLVGEKGPELFTPRGGGTIVPNRDLGGGKAAPMAVTINVTTADAGSFQRSQGQIAAGVVRMLQNARRYS